MDDRTRERLRWRARRGLLENDLLLSRFLADKLESMAEPELLLLDKLLRLDDNELLDLLMGRKACRDADLVPLIANIRNTAIGPDSIPKEETKAQER